MTDKQTIEPCMGCSALECWGVVDCDVAQRVLALHKTLTEIKELIQSDYCTEIGSCKFCAEVGNCLNRKILQKISEVEDGN